jgi:hypothetical protein
VSRTVPGVTEDDVPALPRVLRENGSTPIWAGPRYPCIAGERQDHVPFRLLHEPGMR